MWLIQPIFTGEDKISEKAFSSQNEGDFLNMRVDLKILFFYLKIINTQKFPHIHIYSWEIQDLLCMISCENSPFYVFINIIYVNVLTDL